MVLRLTVQLIESAAIEPGGTDYKTKLQELAAEKGLDAPNYDLQGEGPDHDRSFTAKILIGAEVFGEGSGSSKKRAEQSAAEAALVKLSRI